MTKKLKICLVVAVRNEQTTLKNFIDEIKKTFDNVINYDIRILFVEDGSTDNTRDTIRLIELENSFVKSFSLVNPYGQGLALAWGISKSKSDAVISIDVDGSHPVAIIKEMINCYLEGFDVVQGKRIQYKRDSWYRQLVSSIYFFILTMITGIDLQQQNVHFRLMSSRACEIFRENKSWWFSLRTNFRRRHNLKITYIPFVAPERITGNSKFNFKRLLYFAFKSFLTLTTPLRFTGLICLLLLITGALISVSIWLAIIMIIIIIVLISKYIMVRSIDYLEQIKQLD